MNQGIQDRKKIAIKAGKDVGKILKKNFGRKIHIQSKGDRDLVTNIDKQAEKAIIGLIRRNFPDDGILSEESPDYSSRSGYRWIIDPIDGTHNFIHHIEIFGISIAVEYKGKVILAVIYMPITDELYTAERGKGAFCNGRRIKVSRRKIRQATLIFDSSLRLNKKRMLPALGRLVDRIFNVRMFGCTVRSLTYIAEGKCEIELEFNDKVWDFAAGLLLVEEAGGKATDLAGEPWNTKIQGYIASNAVVHRQALDIIKKV